MTTKCLCIETRLAAQVLTNLYDVALSGSGLTVTQFSQMYKIKSLEQPTLTVLAQSLGLDRSTLGRNISVLTKSGHVNIVVGTDARTRVLKLTAKGLRALKKAKPMWYQAQSSITARLGPEKHALLQALLTEVTSETQQLRQNS